MQPDSIHLVSQRPKIDRLYAVISAAICADLPASHMVLTFQVPNNVVALEVRKGVGIAASFRLSLRRVTRVTEETSSPPKTDVTLCVFPMVSVISLYPCNYGFCNLFVSPPSFTRAPLARRFRGSEQAFMATVTARGTSPPPYFALHSSPLLTCCGQSKHSTTLFVV